MSEIARQLLRMARELLSSSHTFHTDGSANRYPNLSSDIKFSEYEAEFRVDPSVYQGIRADTDTVEAAVDRMRKLIGSEYIVEGKFFRSSESVRVDKGSRRLWDFGKAWALNTSAYGLRSGFFHPKSMSRVTFRLGGVREDRGLISLDTEIEVEITPFESKREEAKTSVVVKGGELVLRDGKVERETEKAILVSVEGKKVWLPKSRVRQTDGEIGIPMWLARKVPEFAEYLS